MDQQRQFLQAYEYLCHIGEAKEWIEDVVHKDIPPIVQLEEALRDGVTLAEVVEALNPERRFRIFRHQRLQFRHSDNIAIFFRYLDEVELPDLFRFELIDIPFKFHHPMWRENAEVDLEYHVRPYRVDPPGGRRELDEAVGRIASTPLDRSRPLWEMYFIEHSRA